MTDGQECLLVAHCPRWTGGHAERHQSGALPRLGGIERAKDAARDLGGVRRVVLGARAEALGLQGSLDRTAACPEEFSDKMRKWLDILYQLLLVATVFAKTLGSTNKLANACALSYAYE